MPSVYPPAAEIEISAPIGRVWDVLLDTAAYRRWNSFIPVATGDPTVLLTPIRMRVRLGGRRVGAVMRSVRVEPPLSGQALWVHEHASWLARTGLVRSKRHHQLTALSAGATHYRTWEPFSGLLKSFVPFADIDAGFKQQAADLKAVCQTQLDVEAN